MHYRNLKVGRPSKERPLRIYHPYGDQIRTLLHPFRSHVAAEKRVKFESYHDEASLLSGQSNVVRIPTFVNNTAMNEFAAVYLLYIYLRSGGP